MKEDRKFKRQCAACRQYKQKAELIRIAKDYKTGSVYVNSDSSVQGRSVYICRSSECIQKFSKNKRALSRFKVPMPENIKEILDTVLKKQIVIKL